MAILIYCLNKSEVNRITLLWIIRGPKNQANLLKNYKYTYCAKISNLSSRYTQKQYTRYIVDAMFYNKQANVKRVPLMLSGINMSMSCGEFKNRFCRRSLKSNITPYLCTASIFISYIIHWWFLICFNPDIIVSAKTERNRYDAFIIDVNVTASC